jgi:type IV pilus assembly protein PilM
VSPPIVSVLLIAAPRNITEKYVKLISMAGLNVVAVETELMSLVRALAPEGKTALLVDFGAKSTDIAIAKNGMLSFSRSIPIAGEAFTRAIAQGLGIELAQAEEYKKAYGLSGNMLEGKIRSALSPIFRIVADEIKKAIHFYQSEDKEESPTSVILSGGSSGMPEVISFLSKLINIEVMPGNPFSKIRLDSEAAKTLAPYAPLYSIAVGLAERGE